MGDINLIFLLILLFIYLLILGHNSGGAKHIPPVLTKSVPVVYF